jgi:hypothetical protein
MPGPTLDSYSMVFAKFSPIGNYAGSRYIELNIACVEKIHSFVFVYLPERWF